MEKTTLSNDVKNAMETTTFNINDIFTKDYSEQFMVQNGNKVAYKVEYNLYNKVKDHTSLKLTDKDMINSTEKIRLALTAGEKMKKVLCREIYNLSKNEKLEKLGFKTVAAYCKAMFDMATSTAGLYSQIGQYFISDDYTDVIDETEYLKVGHLLELLPLVKKDMSDELKYTRLETIVEAFNAGYINDMMSTKAMRQAIKENYPELVESKKSNSKKATKKAENNDSDTSNEEVSEGELDDVLRGARTLSDIDYFKRIAEDKNLNEEVEVLKQAADLIAKLIAD